MTFFQILRSFRAPIGSIFAAALAVSAQAEEEPNRIVAVGGAITEIVFALGEEDRLVARDTTSNHPEAARELPDIGYIRRLSPEGILSVDPDLIISLEGAGPPEAMDILQEAAIPVVEIPEGFTGDAVVAKITAVSEALGVPEKGAALSEKVRNDLAKAKAATAGLDEKRVLFILSLANGRVMAAGQNSSAQGIIELAGAVNAASGFDGYKPITEEAILASNADVILLMERSGPMGITNEQIFSNPALAATPAGQNNAVVRLDGMMMLGFSVRTAEAVTSLATALNQAGS